jgi:hypothetical protein
VNELHTRSEDLRDDEVMAYLVATAKDRELIDRLKSRTPVVLRGSRGVGKSILLRAAQIELTRSFQHDRILPVYVSFLRAAVIKDPSPERYLAYMTSKICNRIVRAATSLGLTIPSGSTIDSLRGSSSLTGPSRMERLEARFENFFKRTPKGSTSFDVPDPEILKDAAEDLCESADLDRIVLFIDEAAHVFAPGQQRQFFTLMRDLRSPYISVKAAVYPGATAYGDSFQPGHDALQLTTDRDILDNEYLAVMRRIVLRQDESRSQTINQYGEVFDTLAFAATGNPRTLITTVSRATPFNKRNAQDVIRQYYRNEIWADHSALTERYPGHKPLIDWGRHFVEMTVLPELRARNARLSDSSSYLWVHKDAPPPVHSALRLLCYSGILQEGASGVRGASGIGSRYLVNIGCQLALDADPIAYGLNIRKSLDVRRMVEYGSKHLAFQPLDGFSMDDIEKYPSAGLDLWLKKPITVLDLTLFQKEAFRELGLRTIEDVLAADESLFTRVKYVGAVRSRQMRNVALTAALEYLSG